MKIEAFILLAALSLIQTGCTMPGYILREHNKAEKRKLAQPFENITSGVVPVTVGQSPEFSPAKVRAIAVIVICPEDLQRNHYYAGPSPLLLPNRKSMIETAVDQELLTKGYRVVARSDIDSLLKEIGFQNSAAVRSTNGSLLASDRGTAQLGKMLKVDAVAIVRLNQAQAQDDFYNWRIGGKSGRSLIGKTVNIDLALRLVVVERGEALWVGSQNANGLFQSIPSLDAACAASAKTIASKLPEKPARGASLGRTLQEIVGGPSR